MGLNIRILSGKRQGESFKLRAGISIGRKNADLNIKDSKMSSLHALIEERDGRMVLVDQGSRNKIVHNGAATKELALEDGVKFLLGETEFEIYYIQTGDVWEEQLGDMLKIFARNTKNVANPVYPFFIPTELKVIQGPDRGKTYLLGYGPRHAGKDSLDLLFQEHFERSELFLIEENNQQVIFKTKHPDLFAINDKPVLTETILTDGDIIAFGKTHIKVSMAQ